MGETRVYLEAVKKDMILLESSQASSAGPSDKGSMKVKTLERLDVVS
jgi:hypothetical protein